MPRPEPCPRIPPMLLVVSLRSPFSLNPKIVLGGRLGALLLPPFLLYFQFPGPILSSNCQFHSSSLLTGLLNRPTDTDHSTLFATPLSLSMYAHGCQFWIQTPVCYRDQPRLVPSLPNLPTLPTLRRIRIQLVAGAVVPMPATPRRLARTTGRPGSTIRQQLYRCWRTPWQLSGTTLRNCLDPISRTRLQ